MTAPTPNSIPNAAGASEGCVAAPNNAIRDTNAPKISPMAACREPETFASEITPTRFSTMAASTSTAVRTNAQVRDRNALLAQTVEPGNYDTIGSSQQSPVGLRRPCGQLFGCPRNEQ